MTGEREMTALMTSVGAEVIGTVTELLSGQHFDNWFQSAHDNFRLIVVKRLIDLRVNLTSCF